MLGDQLLPEEAIDEVKGSPAERFLRLSSIIESNYEYISSKKGVSLDALQRTVVAQLTAVAQELDVGEVYEIEPGAIDADEFAEFMASIAAIRTRLRLRSGSPSPEMIVELRRSARVRIELEINNLKEIVSTSDLEEKERDRIVRRLDDILVDIRRKRFNLQKFATIAAAIATICGGTSTALANAPKAAETVFAIFGIVGEEQDDRPGLLMPPPKALPPPSEHSSTDNGAEEQRE